MSERNSDHNDLRLREILNEQILRDIILFILFYLLLLTQGWDTLFLLLFPIITFSFALFFRIIATNKRKGRGVKNLISYNPLGAENKYADRLVFISIIQLILLFWLGAESLYHPQLIDDFEFYFNLSYFLIYSFGFFWLFIGIWKYCRIVIDISGLKEDKRGFKEILVSELGFNKVKIISYLNIVVFIILNCLNIIFIIMIDFNFNFGFPNNLPGTGIEESKPLHLPYLVWGILLIFPVISGIFLRSIYKDVTNFSEQDFRSHIGDIPEEIQNQIIRSMKNVNKKLFIDFEIS
ncbi:MAG: hypothetical protein P8Y23_07465 [Candidatus Lokiarchaeota archaeon]|jgi:hypothetical protein